MAGFLSLHNFTVEKTPNTWQANLSIQERHAKRCILFPVVNYSLVGTYVDDTNNIILALPSTGFSSSVKENISFFDYIQVCLTMTCNFKRNCKTTVEKCRIDASNANDALINAATVGDIKTVYSIIEKFDKNTKLTPQPIPGVLFRGSFCHSFKT